MNKVTNARDYKIREKLNEERIELLCKKHSNENLSEEELDRLGYLTKEIEILFPSVTDKEFGVLNELHKCLIQDSTDLDPDAQEIINDNLWDLI